MVDVTFQEERYTDSMWEEFWPVLEAHKDEIANVGDGVELQPIRSIYDSLAESGSLIVVTARVGKKLVGYVVVFLSPHLHYASILVAQQDVFFLLPEYRKGFTGRDLLRYAEKIARNRGAAYMRQNVKPDRRDFGVLLKREKYSLVENIYEKRL